MMRGLQGGLVQNVEGGSIEMDIGLIKCVISASASTLFTVFTYYVPSLRVTLEYQIIGGGGRVGIKLGGGGMGLEKISKINDRGGGRTIIRYSRVIGIFCGIDHFYQRR